ncbi:DUF4331 family protein [Poritiphilus flavus]|uniref:DUF4331 domain-containing protein n=1 Tax=Poritiphilus flavus TaxID=2697053 RepID=A0A6L9EAB2_9FLAO|nr:DUF4331 family protein [Poritiphilus flavus]NAS11604.1 DUF4331 domain-containing protein [Poritiphilus flavus]
MKKTRLITGIGVLVAAGAFLISADHIDAPSSMGTTADIADFYAFEPTEGSDLTTFVVDLQSNVLPDLAYGTFDEDILTEINIDLDGDLVEDKVIQAIPRNGRMYYFYGDPGQTGLSSSILENNPLGDVEISSSSAVIETTSDGVRIFAGPRQDPFFFDFFQFNAVIGGMAPEGFKTPDEAEDTFDGANTLSIVVEMPNAMLGTPTGTNALGLTVYKAWVTTNRKQ